MRALGFLLLGMGAVLSLTTWLALAGVIPLQIDFFGFNLDTRNERIALAFGWLLVALIGLVLLRVSKHSRERVGKLAA